MTYPVSSQIPVFSEMTMSTEVSIKTKTSASPEKIKRMTKKIETLRKVIVWNQEYQNQKIKNCIISLAIVGSIGVTLVASSYLFLGPHLQTIFPSAVSVSMGVIGFGIANALEGLRNDKIKIANIEYHNAKLLKYKNLYNFEL